MSYLIIPTASGTRHRRVDFSAIGELFVEDEPVTVAPPRKLFRATTAFRTFVVPFKETLGLLRDEALARKLPTVQPAQRVVRAFGI